LLFFLLLRSLFRRRRRSFFCSRARSRLSDDDAETEQTKKPTTPKNPQQQTPQTQQSKQTKVCSELDVDGIRGDIVTNRASKALAAFEGREEVALEDVYRVAPLCLRHRLRKDPLADIDDGDRVRDVFKRVFGLE
jgi:Mg-chelatase subunit ChlI